MSSSLRTPRGQLSEEALAGILSSSELPGQTNKSRQYGISPASSDQLSTHTTPLFKFPRPHPASSGTSIYSLRPKAQSTPIYNARTPTTPASGKIAGKSGSSSHSLQPYQHYPGASNAVGNGTKSQSKIQPLATSSSTPLPLVTSDSNSNQYGRDRIGARTPSSGFSSEKAQTSSFTSSKDQSCSDLDQTRSNQKPLTSKYQPLQEENISEKRIRGKASGVETSVTSGVGSFAIGPRAAGFESSSSNNYQTQRTTRPSVETNANVNTKLSQIRGSGGVFPIGQDRQTATGAVSDAVGYNVPKASIYGRHVVSGPSASSSNRCAAQSSSSSADRRGGGASDSSSIRAMDRRGAGASDSSSMRAGSPQNKRARVEGTTNDNDDSDSDDIAEEETETQIYMSLMWSHGHLGMAYYDLDTQQIHLMPDVKEEMDFQLAKQILDQVRPHCAIVSASQDLALMDVLKAHGSANESASGDGIHQFLQLLPTLEFSYESSKRRALMLSLPGMSDDCSEDERSIHISALVPMDKINMMRAFGGLLKYLDKVRVGVQLEAADIGVPILAINTFSLAEWMVMDDVAYSALDIFKKAANPSTRIAGWSQESRFSLFGVLNRCRSVNGAKLLRMWLLRPTRDLEVLKERQEAIAFFKRSANLEVVSKLRACIAGVRTVARILPQMKRNSVSLKNWKILYKTVYNSIFVSDICSQITPRLPVFQKISKVAGSEYLQKIAHHINKIADFEEFAKTGMFSVKPGVDEELDRMKRTYNGLPDFMTLVAKKELDQLSEDIHECNVTYLPQLGYLLVIPVTDEMMQEDSYEQPNLEFKFVSNGQAFYKNDATVELDRQLGDTESLIQDRQTSIMHQLQDIIISHSPALQQMIDSLAQLDCLMGLAMVARENNYVCPTLTREHGISIRAGRHPIQEHLCSPFVANDYESDESRVKLLTGPNASGKSVYLKQVALIVFMAHIGSYVPARSASIGLVDRIFTCLKARESPSMGMSSFMTDLNMVSNAANCCKPNSLVLLDEFGKGTDTVSGMSLLVAILSQWLEQGDRCPHAVVSTHFHSIGHDKRLPNTPLLQFQMMESVSDGLELVFLYQLVPGCATTSHACHVAAKAGLPQEIISRGQEVSELLRKEEAVGRVDTASTASQHERCQRIVSKFLELDLKCADIDAFLKKIVLKVDSGQL